MVKYVLAELLTLSCISACIDTSDLGDTGDVSSAITTQTGVDYSWARPSPAGLRAAGYTFAVRYLSYDTTGKNLTASEASALRAAGVDVVSNWEYGASDALKGRARGASDAQEALRQASAAGMPDGRPIYFSVDFDASESQQAAINDYFDGVASALGLARTGAYGGFFPIQRLFNAGKIAWGWQTFAWSGGQWEPRAQLRQVRNGVTVAGGDCDIDEAQTADFGQWGHSGGGGALHQIYGDSTGWHDPSTGVSPPAGSAFSAVNMGSQAPVVMANENGVLHEISGSGSSWHDDSTAISIGVGSAISAVNMGNPWPQVMANENGVLYQIYGDNTGWHNASTGISLPAGTSFSAVNMGGQWPQVMANENGVLHEISRGASGWHDDSAAIGIAVGSVISAVNMGNPWPQVMANENGVLYQIYGDSTGWHNASTGISLPAGTSFSAVNMGGQWPQVMANENGALHEISGDASGWHNPVTGLASSAGSAISAVNMGDPWPQVMIIE